MTRYRFFATTARGLEPVLAGEIKGLEPLAMRSSHGGVFFEGPMTLAYRANLWLRTAQRVLLPVLERPCSSYDALYALVSELDWRDHLPRGRTFAVEAACFDSPLRHSHHAALRIKDAVVDQLRARTGVRPDVEVRDPDVRIHAYIHKEICQLSIDLSGDPLFMRRYRVRQTSAPLKETLAAGVLALTRWDGCTGLVDPMCGSGTLVIEAALMALDRAPGRHRSFAFQRHPSYDDEAARQFRALCEEADARALPATSVRLEASDRDPEALSAARANARAAGVAEAIHFSDQDVRALAPGERGAFVVSNPPYGQRLGGSAASVELLYRTVGHRLRAFSSGEAWFLSSSPRFEAALGLPPKARHRLSNGPLEAWLYGYALGGTRGRR